MIFISLKFRLLIFIKICVNAKWHPRTGVCIFFNKALLNTWRLSLLSYWAESYHNNCRNYIVIIAVCHCYHWNIEGTAAFVKTINTDMNISNNKKMRFKFDENCSCELWQYDLQFNLGPWKEPVTCNNLLSILYIIHFNCKIGLLLMPGTVLMLTNCRETVMCLCVCTLNLSLDKTSQVPMYSSSFDALR